MSNALVKLSVVLVVGSLSGGCASWWKEPKAPAGAAEKVNLYNTTQLTPNRYQMVQHIYTDNWHSNIQIPTFANVDEGVAALKEKAAAAGGNGLLNVMCLDARGYHDGRLLCYGDAIKVN